MVKGTHPGSIRDRSHMSEWWWSRYVGMLVQRCLVWMWVTDVRWVMAMEAAGW